MTVEDLKYLDIFNDHMQIAKERFIEKYGYEPTVSEHISEYTKLMDYFYD